MKSLQTIILCFLAFYGLVAAASAPVPDSSLRAKSVDEDLILDEGPSSVLPDGKKTAAPAAVIDSQAKAKTAVVPAPVSAPVTAPAANHTIDSTGKKPVPAPAQTANPAAAPQTPPPPAAAAKATPQVKDTAKKIVDEDLILEGGEESVLPDQNRKVPAPASGANVNVPAIGTTVAATDSSAAKQIVTPAARGTAGASPLPGTTTAASATPASGPTHIPVPVAKIENARSINFAANLKDYRSPKLAMLMSLIVPGSGQFYAESNWWGAGFLVVEAALIGTGLVYSAQSNAKKSKAHAFADTAYDAKKFKTYTDSLKNNLKGNNAGSDSAATAIYSSVFIDSSDISFLNDANKGPGKRSNDFYTNIAGKNLPFVQGWKDAKPTLTSTGFGSDTGTTYHAYNTTAPDSTFFVYKNNDKANFSYGFSSYQDYYNSILKESQNLANYSRDAFLTLLINHLASAVMAGIQAKSHNDALLGKESLWRHLDIEQQFVYTGTETVPGYSVGVRF